MNLYILIGIGLLIAWVVIYIKYFKKEPEDVEEEPVEPPVEPEPPIEPEEPPVDPPKEPEKPVEPPKYNFVPYRFTGLNILFQSEDSKVVEIHAPDTGEDLTDYVQEKVNSFPSGSLLAPTLVRFVGEFWTEGNAAKTKALSCAIHVKDKHFFIMEGGSFFTKAPATPYGGKIGKSLYSKRRHFRFEDCTGFVVRDMEVQGANTIDGGVIGSTPELTPDFWYLNNYLDSQGIDWSYKHEDGKRIPAPKDNGAIASGFPVYRADWEFEHAFDFLNCKNFLAEGLKAHAVFGDGLCFGFGCENFIARDCHLSSIGRQGVAMYSVKNYLLDNITLKNGRRAFIDKEPNGATGYVLNGEVKNCNAHTMQTAFAMIGQGDVSDIHIHNNKYHSGGAVYNADSSGITRRKNIAFIDNERLNGFGSPDAPIKFRNVDNIIIKGNKDHLSKNQSKSVLLVEDCTGVVWEDNHVINGEIIYSHNSEIEVKGTELEIVEI